MVVIGSAALRLGPNVALKRIFGYENLMTADVDHFIIVHLRRIVDAERTTQLIRTHERVQAAQQLEIV